MKRLGSTLLVSFFALALIACTETAASENRISEIDPLTAEEQIWAMEAAIFEGRGQGDLSNYLNVTSDSYLGWPPVMAKPLGLEKFRASAADASALKGEKITFVKDGFTLSDNTAVTYFTTHRTRLGDGFASEGQREVDEYYENIHVWTLERGEWRLIGGMARKLPDPKGRQSSD